MRVQVQVTKYAFALVDAPDGMTPKQIEETLGGDYFDAVEVVDPQPSDFAQLLDPIIGIGEKGAVVIPDEMHPLVAE